MIARRGLPALALLALSGAARAAPADIAFRVVREGSHVGTHRVRFQGGGDTLEAISEVRVQVRLVGITVYRYSHDVAEAWRSERLVSLSSRLDRNGTPLACEVRADARGLTLRGSGGEARLPVEAAPLTWWRAATLRPGVLLFDPRAGIAVAPRLEFAQAGAGTRVRLIGGEGAEIVYDGAGNWVGFATTGEDGSAVRYERA